MRIARRFKQFIAEGAHSFFAEISPLIGAFQQKTGLKPIFGHIGEPGEEPNARVRERLARASLDSLRFSRAHHYGPIAGTLEARTAFASHFKRRKFFGTRAIHPDQIVITVSGKMAMNILSLLLIEIGDKCAVFGPTYPGHAAGPVMAGGRLIRIPVREENEWSPNPDEMRSILRKERPKFVIVCDPQNPTGGILSSAAREILVEYVAESGAFVFEDTIYHDHVYVRGYKPLSSCRTIEDNIFIVDGASKNQSATGWRLGIIILPPRRYKELLPKILTLQNTFYSCPPSPLVEAIIPGFLPQGDVWIERNQRAYAARRDIVVAGANSLPGVECKMPHGAFYAMWNIQKTGLTPDEFTRKAARDAGVTVLPAKFFGERILDYHGCSLFPEAGKYVRYSYVGPLADQKEAMKRLQNVFCRRRGGK